MLVDLNEILDIYISGVEQASSSLITNQWY